LTLRWQGLPDFVGAPQRASVVLGVMSSCSGCFVGSTARGDAAPVELDGGAIRSAVMSIGDPMNWNESRLDV